MSTFTVCLLVMFGVPALCLIPCACNACDKRKAQKQAEYNAMIARMEQEHLQMEKERKQQEKQRAEQERRRQADCKRAMKQAQEAQKYAVKLARMQELAELAERRLAAERALADLNRQVKSVL